MARPNAHARKPGPRKRRKLNTSSTSHPDRRASFSSLSFTSDAQPQPAPATPSQSASSLARPSALSLATPVDVSAASKLPPLIQASLHRPGVLRYARNLLENKQLGNEAVLDAVRTFAQGRGLADSVIEDCLAEVNAELKKRPAPIITSSAAILKRKRSPSAPEDTRITVPTPKTHPGHFSSEGSLLEGPPVELHGKERKAWRNRHKRIQKALGLEIGSSNGAPSPDLPQEATAQPNFANDQGSISSERRVSEVPGQVRYKRQHSPSDPEDDPDIAQMLEARPEHFSAEGSLLEEPPNGLRGKQRKMWKKHHRHILQQLGLKSNSSSATSLIPPQEAVANRKPSPEKESISLEVKSSQKSETTESPKSVKSTVSEPESSVDVAEESDDTALQAEEIIKEKNLSPVKLNGKHYGAVELDHSPTQTPEPEDSASEDEKQNSLAIPGRSPEPKLEPESDADQELGADSESENESESEEEPESQSDSESSKESEEEDEHSHEAPKQANTKPSLLLRRPEATMHASAEEEQKAQIRAMFDRLAPPKLESFPSQIPTKTQEDEESESESSSSSSSSSSSDSDSDSDSGPEPDKSPEPATKQLGKLNPAYISSSKLESSSGSGSDADQKKSSGAPTEQPEKPGTTSESDSSSESDSDKGSRSRPNEPHSLITMHQRTSLSASGSNSSSSSDAESDSRSNKSPASATRKPQKGSSPSRARSGSGTDSDSDLTSDRPLSPAPPKLSTMDSTSSSASSSDGGSDSESGSEKSSRHATPQLDSRPHQEPAPGNEDSPGPGSHVKLKFSSPNGQIGHFVCVRIPETPKSPKINKPLNNKNPIVKDESLAEGASPPSPPSRTDTASFNDSKNDEDEPMPDVEEGSEAEDSVTDDEGTAEKDDSSPPRVYTVSFGPDRSNMDTSMPDAAADSEDASEPEDDEVEHNGLVKAEMLPPRQPSSVSSNVNDSPVQENSRARRGTSEEYPWIATTPKERQAASERSMMSSAHKIGSVKADLAEPLEDVSQLDDATAAPFPSTPPAAEVVEEHEQASDAESRASSYDHEPKGFFGPDGKLSSQKRHTGLRSQHFSPSTSSQKPKRPHAGTVSCLPFPSIKARRFGLIQEELAHKPFQLLVAVIFLNKKKGEKAIPKFREFIEKYPGPDELAHANLLDVVAVIRPLGLFNTRANTLIEFAKRWLEDPPQSGRRFRVVHYPFRGAQKDIKPGEILDDTDPRVAALEIAHLPGCGPYALDSWRIFCRDVLRGVALDWNGAGVGDEGFEPEWKRVKPGDKELRTFLRWMWLREGWEWDPDTGTKKLAKTEEVKIAEEHVRWDQQTGQEVWVENEEPEAQGGDSGDDDDNAGAAKVPLANENGYRGSVEEDDDGSSSADDEAEDDQEPPLQQLEDDDEEEEVREDSSTDPAAAQLALEASQSQSRSRLQVPATQPGPSPSPASVAAVAGDYDEDDNASTEKATDSEAEQDIVDAADDEMGSDSYLTSVAQLYKRAERSAKWYFSGTVEETPQPESPETRAKREKVREASGGDVEDQDSEPIDYRSSGDDDEEGGDGDVEMMEVGSEEDGVGVRQASPEL